MHGMSRRCSILRLEHTGPVAIRYPKANAVEVGEARSAADRTGPSEVLRWGHDGVDSVLRQLARRLPEGGRLLAAKVWMSASSTLALPSRSIGRSSSGRCANAVLSLTVEEGCLMGGFGSAVLEAASEMGLDTSRIKRLGIPDRFIEHGERAELLADLGLDASGIAAACRELAEQGEGVASA